MRIQRRSIATLVFSLLAVSSASCISFDPPKSFLVTWRGAADLKAITPDESKLWVRNFPDVDRGGLSFWVEALKRDFVDNRGYVLISDAAIKDGAGTAGHEVLVESTVGGRPMRELLCVFVYGGLFEDNIRVVEFVADKTAFDRELTSVRTSVSAMRP